MFCGECGTANPDTNKFCKNCGKPLGKHRQATEPAAALPVTPAGSQAGSSAVAPLQPAGETTARHARNWLALFSFIISLVSWLIYPVIIGFFAVLLGISSLYTAKKKKAKIPISAVIAIIIGMLAVILNFFWLEIFPPPALLPPIK
jgi:hypothetical protein